MNKSLIAVAAAAFAVTFAPAAEAGFNLRVGGATSLVQKAEWDAEDAADYIEERAEAREEAYEDSDALEDGEGAYPRQRSARRQSQPRAKVRDTAQAREKPAQASTETPSKTADVSDKPETKKSDAKKTEAKSAVAAADGSRSCKQFFPSVGMTLSVPCE